MNKTIQEAVDFMKDLKGRLESVAPEDVEIVVAPPFTALAALTELCAGSPIQLGAQNVYPQAEGAYTGEISPGMLLDLGCRYVIVGHSERRALFGEPSQTVARKAAFALKAGLRPIVCVGETLEEREAGRTFDVVGEQIDASLDGLEEASPEQIAVAYEPVWAIGTGRTATVAIAQEAHAFIRERLAKRFGEGADGIRIQYGGSVKPGNAAELMAQPDIDGALVGGASLDPSSFFAIIRYQSPSKEPSQ